MSTTTPQKRNTLTHAQFYALCEWIKTANLKGVCTKVEAARRATAGLGFDISDHSIGGALEATGMELDKPELANSTKRRDRSVIVARALMDLMRQLDVAPPEDLVRVAQAQSLE